MCHKKPPVQNRLCARRKPCGLCSRNFRVPLLSKRILESSIRSYYPNLVERSGGKSKSPLVVAIMAALVVWKRNFQVCPTASTTIKM